jgi:hypothetical protein
MSAFTTGKALRLLLMGGVVVRCSERGIEAIVQGDTREWQLYRERGGWRCTCPSRRRCSHIEAVERVTGR